MPKWFWYSILSVFFWGAWGALSKIAMEMMSPMTNQVLFTLGMFPVLLIATRSKRTIHQGNRLRGGTYAFITTFLGGIGNVTLYEALSHGGKASTVVPITGLYPLPTVIAAIPLLGEKLNWIQGVGITLAVVAVLLLSGSGN